MVVTAMTQEKPGELLTGLAQTADGRKTRTYEIADRLMSLIGNPHSGQFTGAMQLGELDRIRYRIDSIGRRRSLTRDKSYYALETLPTYARRGGNAWADDFARLSKHEQNVIVWRMVTQASRAAARRAGRPDPIWVEHTVKPLPGGGYVKAEGSEVPLRPEYGGDGRTPENTRYEQPESHRHTTVAARC